MSLSKRQRRALFGILVLTLLTLFWDRFSLTRGWEQDTLDFRYARFNRAAKATDRVVVIDLDEQGMKAMAPVYGRWPWPRRIYKTLIEFLSLGEPSGVFFDLLFTEGQQGSDDDQQLAEAAAQTKIASFASLLLEDPAQDIEGVNPLPSDLSARFGLKISGTPMPQAKHFRDYLLPAPPYMGRIPKLHVVGYDKDADGVFRHSPLLFQYENTWLPSLSLQALLSTLKNPRIEALPGELRLSGDGDQHLTVPLDRFGTYPLHFYQPALGPERIPVGAVIESALRLQRGEVADPKELTVNPLEFKDKVILVGASATGLEDLKATPVASAYPGVLLHATTIANVLSHDFPRHPPAPLRVTFTLGLLLLTYCCVFFLEHIALKVALPLLALIAYSASGIFLFQHHQIIVDLAMPGIVTLAALFDGLAYISFVEGREKKKLKGTLSKYLSPDVMEQLIASGKDPRAEVGDRKELSIVFSDVRGFTTISEAYKAEEVVSILNQYLGRMTDVIFEYRGTLDKFIGDAIMCFWGAPMPEPDHALKALRCAFAMRKALQRLQAEWGPSNQISLEAGIGINTGEVIVGNIGSEKRLDYTVIGDNVNLASRLESLTKQYRIHLIVGERTEELIRNSVICRPVDKVKVKGKNQSVRIYEPLCESQDAEKDSAIQLAKSFSVAWEQYEKGDFRQALEGFRATDAMLPPQGDGLSKVYIERCKDLISHPPEGDWDGVFVAKTK